MVKSPIRALAPALLIALGACAGRSPDGVSPRLSTSPSGPDYLARSHAHNDYAQSRPLLGALERGFASIEVDIVLSGGELFVAHAPEEIQPSVTLRSLYLDPLREVVRRNGGSVYSTAGQRLQLLVDVKTEADETYQVLHDVLHEYSDLFTRWTDGEPEPGAVTAVLSGNRAKEVIASDRVRYVAIDGRILDDRSGVSADAMPLVSADWEDLGPPVREERLERAASVIEQMHAEGRQVRFWATPEDEQLWRSLLAMGVDYIGTDAPLRLERLLREVGDAEARAID